MNFNPTGDFTLIPVHTMATDILRNGALLLMSEKCYDNYFIDLNFLHGELIVIFVLFPTHRLLSIVPVACFKALLSKGLGLGIIAGSILVKVPQIVKIWANKSGEGINIYSVLVDLFAITCHVSYSFVNGFPFSAWGDGSFLMIQTAIIAALVFHFSGATMKALLFLLAYSGICYVTMGGITPLEVLWSAQAFNVPIILVGKMIQAVTNYKAKSTGQLSAVTCLLLFAGSVARIFTSYQETGDFMMILTYCVSSVANAVIVSQLFYYWNSDGKAAGKGQATVKKGANSAAGSKKAQGKGASTSSPVKQQQQQQQEKKKAKKSNKID